MSSKTDVNDILVRMEIKFGDDFDEEDAIKFFGNNTTFSQKQLAQKVFETHVKNQNTEHDAELYSTVEVTRVRNYKKKNGSEVMMYEKTYHRWSDEEKAYIKEQKQNKIPVQITVSSYNSKFNQQQRSSSSIKSRYYRS